ncbi:MAG: hypothetical protein MUF31_14990 [Akkermansiaceae bacterium]|jgi:hypothetical protein|nr:hypothetical protein [Akkermansiaceae bacterium]
MSEEIAPTRKKGSCLIIGLVVLLVIGVAAGATWWWHNRPIEPVTLSAAEVQVVEEKIGSLQGAPIPAAEDVRPDPTYEPGVREIVLTERELNGLLNQNTTLGDKLRFELVPDAIHARVETDLDPDLPLVGGKKLKARARFFVTQDDKGSHFVIDDVTIWGVSLPNDWLGGLKGRDLIGEAVGGQGGGGLAGVKSMKVESGRIRIELKE